MSARQDNQPHQLRIHESTTGTARRVQKLSLPIFLLGQRQASQSEDSFCLLGKKQCQLLRQYHPASFRGHAVPNTKSAYNNTCTKFEPLSKW